MGLKLKGPMPDPMPTQPGPIVSCKIRGSIDLPFHLSPHYWAKYTLSEASSTFSSSSDIFAPIPRLCVCVCVCVCVYIYIFIYLFKGLWFCIYTNTQQSFYSLLIDCMSHSPLFLTIPDVLHCNIQLENLKMKRSLRVIFFLKVTLNFQKYVKVKIKS